MALLAVVAALSLLSGVAAEVVEVCVVGDVMDVYCINRGTLLDASSYRTLEHPGQHSIHCLVDVSFCYGSGFEILVPPTSGSDYCRAVRLDTAGRDAAMAMARQSTSACSTCTGPSSGPSKGFRATVRGTIDTASTASPPVLTTTSVEAANVGCGGEPLHPLTCGEAVDNGDNEDGDGGSSSSSTGSTDASSGGDGGSDGSDADRDDEEARALLAGVGLPRAAVLHRPSEGDAPDVAVAWSLTGSMVEVAIAARSAGWVAVGFAPAGAEATSAMVGSDVVMGAVIGDGEGGGGGEAGAEGKRAGGADVSPSRALSQTEPDPPSVGVWSLQCKRGQHDNEDRARCVLGMPSPAGPVDFFSVLDGHGGGDCATFCQEKLHTYIAETGAWARGDFRAALLDGVAACEKAFMATGMDSGSCIVVALLVGGGIGVGGKPGQERTLYVANCGDCRAILCSLDGKRVRAVTKDHKPADPDEKQRVEDAGGLIFGGRLFGIIAVARSLGDAQLKGDGPGGTALSPVPDVFVETISPDGSAGDAVLVMACDGVWDELTNEAVASKAATGLQKGAKRAARKLASVREAGDAESARVRDPGAHLAARRVVSDAAQTGFDDCTAVVVPLVRPRAEL